MADDAVWDVHYVYTDDHHGADRYTSDEAQLPAACGADEWDVYGSGGIGVQYFVSGFGYSGAVVCDGVSAGDDHADICGADADFVVCWIEIVYCMQPGGYCYRFLQRHSYDDYSVRSRRLRTTIVIFTCSQEATETDFYKDTVMMIILSAAGGYEQQL